MNKYFYFIPACILALLCINSHAEIYSWTDEKGNKHFSNISPGNFEIEELMNESIISEPFDPSMNAVPEEEIQASIEKRKAEEKEREKKLEQERIAEEKRRFEAERKAKAEAERKTSPEAIRKAKEEAERKAKVEAERKAKEEEQKNVAGTYDPEDIKLIDSILIDESAYFDFIDENYPNYFKTISRELPIVYELMKAVF